MSPGHEESDVAGRTRRNGATPMRCRAGLLVGLLPLAAAVLLSGCAGAEVLEPTNPIASYRKSRRSSLGGEGLSDASLQYLEQRDLARAWRDQPLAAIKALDPVLREERERAAALTLAETCYARLAAEDDRPLQARLLCSALLYAWVYLFEDRLEPPLNRFDPNFRRACEIYNRCLGLLVDATNRDAKSSEGSYTLPLIVGGPIRTRNGRAELAFDPTAFDRFFVSYDFDVRGIGPLNRIFGLGAPCMALRSPRRRGAREDYLARVVQAYACTVLLRFEGDLLGEPAELGATVELYDPLKTASVLVGDRPVPLEADLTTPLAYMFEKAPRPRRLRSLLDVEELEERRGLFMLQPYQATKIPLVFVHGLLSTPHTWLRMMNGMLADRRIRKRFQIWFFFYPTGNPIVISAAALRKSLLEVRQVFDPHRRHRAFDEMVLVGHSMGGVLSRLMVQSSGERFWNVLSDQPLASYEGLTTKQRARLRSLFWFEPVPHIRRVVFLAAPHRGSALATGLIGRIGSWLTSLPAATLEGLSQLRGLVTGHSRSDFLFAESATGIRSLSPENPFNRVGVQLPIASRVTFHSIMGNEDAAGLVGGGDGVVPYESSHLAGAASELIVRSDHSVQNHPTAVREVRRILHRHLEDVGARRAEPETPAGK